MTDEQTRQLLASMRAAVLAGRQMRARQVAYFKTRQQTQLIAARLAEQEFDDKSLEAVRLEERFQREESQ